mmetsp:Transcript_36020/g.78551  ORF Transcript_36020/g.78551 Transcript_36020/m.78551 type:complete len:81 (-) Transcript_36020:32-274(-)
MLGEQLMAADQLLASMDSGGAICRLLGQAGEDAPALQGIWAAVILDLRCLNHDDGRASAVGELLNMCVVEHTCVLWLAVS